MKIFLLLALLALSLCPFAQSNDCIPASITNVTAADAYICANETTTLTANGVSGTNAIITWYTGPGGTGTVLGTGPTYTAAPGTYYARVTADCGAPVEASVLVSGFALPPLPALAVSYCNNQAPVYLGSQVLTNNGQTFYSGVAWSGTGVTYSSYTTIVGAFTLAIQRDYYFSPSGAPGNRTLTATNMAGCSRTINVEVKATPVLQLTQPLPVCAPATINLTETIDEATSVIPADAVIEYWLNGAQVSNPNAVTQPGTYTIKVIANNGCSTERNLTVTIYPQPSVSHIADSYCNNAGPVFLGSQLLINGGVTPYSGIGWQGTGVNATTFATYVGFLIPAIQKDFYFYPSGATGSRTLTATNIFGCTTSKNVLIKPSPLLNVIQPAPVCAPATIDLTAAVDQTTSVFPANYTLEYYLGTDPVANPGEVSVSGNYTIKLVAENGCIDQKTVNVVIKPQPSVLPLVDEYCNSQPQVFLGTQILYGTVVTSGNTWAGTGISFSTAGPTLFDPTVYKHYYFSPAGSTGVRNITVTAMNGCTNSIAVTIEESPFLQVNQPPSVCAPATIDLTLTTNTATSIIPPGSTFEYYFNGQLVADPTAVSQNGNYTVKLIAPNGCSSEAIVRVSIQPDVPDYLESVYCTNEPNVFIGQQYVPVGETYTPLWQGDGLVIQANPQMILNVQYATIYNYFFSPSTSLGVNNLVMNGVGGCSVPVTITVNQAPLLNVTQPAPVCAPATIDLTAAVNKATSIIPEDATINYLLGGVEVTNPRQVSVGGVYTIQLIAGNGCIDQKTVNVVIKPQPSTAPLLNEYCNNQSDVYLGAQTFNFGIPVFGNSWSGTGITMVDQGDIFGITVNRHFSFNPAMGTSGQRTITVTGLNGCTNSISINIKQAPVLVVSQPAPVCAPATVNLTTAINTTGSSIPEGATIEYLLNGTAVSDPAAVTQSGNYTIKVSYNGCSTEQFVSVIIRPRPVIPNIPTTYCSNDNQVFLGTQTISFGSFTEGTMWSGNGVRFTDQVTDIFGFSYLRHFSFSPSGISGSRVLTATNQFGCTNTVTVQVNPTPVVNVISPLVTCAPATVDLREAIDLQTSSIPSDATIEYFLNGEEIDPAAVSLPGNYTLRVTSAADCFVERTIAVIINPEPVLPSIPTTYCNNAGLVFLGTQVITGGFTFSGGNAWTGPGVTYVEQLINVFTLTFHRNYYLSTAGSTGQRVLTATNQYGCTKTMTVTINPLPAIVCNNSNITAYSDAKACGTTVTYNSPTATGGCGATTIDQIAGIASGDFFPAGTTNNIFKVTDAAGNTATCSFTVTVLDNIPPSITAPSPVTVTANASGCSATATIVNLGTPVTADNCAGETYSNNAPAVYPLGQTIVTWLVTDAAGNTATAAQTVIVNSSLQVTLPPAVYSMPPPNEVDPYTIYHGFAPASQLSIPATVTGGQAPYTYAWTSPTANLQILGATNGSSVLITSAVPGVHQLLLTVTDALGCTATISQNIRVVSIIGGNNNNLVTICHNGNTITVSANAVLSHMNHGDALGSCPLNNAVTTLNPVHTTAEKPGSGYAIKAYPNPSSHNFNVVVSSDDIKTGISLRVMDMHGRIIKTYSNLAPGSTIQLGAEFRPGIYMVEMIQGNRRQQVKLLKQPN